MAKFVDHLPFGRRTSVVVRRRFSTPLPLRFPPKKLTLRKYLRSAPPILDGGGEGDQTKPGLLASVNERLRSGDVASDGDVETVAEVEYFADEVNASLLLRCEEKLIDMGFGPVEDSSDRSFV